MYLCLALECVYCAYTATFHRWKNADDTEKKNRTRTDAMQVDAENTLGVIGTAESTVMVVGVNRGAPAACGGWASIAPWCACGAAVGRFPHTGGPPLH